MERDFWNQPVRSLQAMLRTISFAVPSIPRLVPDGIYGPETAEAVRRFQRLCGLPETGQVDNETWDAVVLAYYDALPRVSPPRPASLFPRPPFAVSPGQCCAQIYPVQAMFQALSLVFTDLEPGPVDGSHTGPSVRNTIWLQRRTCIPDTGVIDHLTWNHLSRLYELFVVRNNNPVLCCRPCSTSPAAPSGTRGFPWEPYGQSGTRR